MAMMDLNGLLLDSTSEKPKKVSVITKYIFANEGCTQDEICIGTGFDSDMVTRKIRELLYDNQVIRKKGAGFHIRFPHHPINERPSSIKDKILGDLYNMHLTLIDAEFPIGNNVVAMDIMDIINRYR